jgi:hypothetical protein
LKKIRIKNFQDAQNISGVLEFICPMMLGILETLKNFNSTPKNVGHYGNILMIPPKKNQVVWEFKNFQSIILGQLLRLKIGFIATQNLEHGKMFKNFII